MTKIKSALLVLIAIIGVFAMAGACSSGGGGEIDLGPGPDGGPAPVDLGTSGAFAILAKTGISTINPSAITGDIGVSPADSTYITGFSLTLDGIRATSPQVTGFVYAPDYDPPTPANMTAAVADMQTAYTDAAGRTLPDFTELYAGDISGKTLEPGLYKWGTGVLMSSDVTLWGSENAVWIFQIGDDLTVANTARVILAGGAQAGNVYWQVATGATLGTTSHFEGTILAQTAVIMNTGSSMNGRALAQTAVTLDQSTVTKP